MAPSLQELIEFLLNEVALCGNQGATLSEILKAIESFYSSSSHDSTQSRQRVDRRFKAKVWSWLTRHPEVSVGESNQWNHLSLDEVEHEDGQVEQALEASTGQEKASPTSTSSHIRVFVSRERTWYAVSGHEPDEGKVPASEFALLSIIASHKSDGVVQTDLVRLSGQDKRSVPKRTDALHRKGYIEKRSIQVRAARTSLCIHSRFMKQSSSDRNTSAAQNAGHERVMIDFHAFTQKLFEILKEHHIVTRDDLKRMLGFEDPWRWRILSRALRKFERIGVLKRVKAASQYKLMHACVMLIRDPTERDLEKFHDVTGELNASADDQADLDEDIEADAVGKNASGADEGRFKIEQEKTVVDVGRAVPSWTPDRPLGNQIFDVVAASGTIGVTNLEINRLLFGSYYRRPSECILHRLVDCWQLSQPPHLRHLAIVRDTAIEKTVFYYIHYSADNFAKLVESGQSLWEAVEYPAQKTKAASIQIPAVDATAQFDQLGFPQTGVSKGLFKNGNGSLFESLAVCRPSNYLLSSSDPVPVRLPDGRFVIEASTKGQPGVVLRFSTPNRPSRGRPKGALGGTSGRPSKLSKLDRGSPESQGIEDIEEVARQLPAHLVFSTTPRVPKYTRRDKVKASGLPEKEMFEALGMDETWTEYNVLVNDIPNPGVYVTPIGKRRPAGKKQGRPSRSRIAVFKSPKLASFPWFAEGQDILNDEEQDPTPETPMMSTHNLDVSSLPAEPSSQGFIAVNPSPDIQVTPVPSRGRKRRGAYPEATDSPTSVSGSTEQPRRSGRGRAKQPRLEDSNEDEIEPLTIDSEIEVRESIEQNKAISEISTGLTKSSAVHHLNPKENQGISPKRRRIGSPGEPVTPRTSLPSDSGKLGTSGTPEPISQEMQTPSLQNEFAKSKTPVIRSTPRQTSIEVVRSSDRGGSISLLRRKILMEIIEKAGGAYPSGTELWYPFATFWFKEKYKEKPDMRTVRTAVKNLVDAGKLRQLTFSGKDSKGVMVTKTILAKPGMSPDDPLIMKMRQKLLTSVDPRVSYSPNIVLDPGLTKSGGRTGLQKTTLPLVKGATVQLQKKPVRVLREEKRVERRIQRDLLKKLDDEFGNPMDYGSSGSKRLLGIRRPREPGLMMGSQTAIFRPQATMSQPQTTIARPRGRPSKDGGFSRMTKTMTTIGPYAMLMHPKQVFHPSSGTFATFGAARKPRTITRKLPGSLADSVHELAELARQAKNPSKTSDKILRWELGHEEMFDAILDDHPYIDQTVRDEFVHAPIEGEIRFDFDQPAPVPRTPRSIMRTRTASTHRHLLPKTAVSDDSTLSAYTSQFRTSGALKERRVDRFNTSISAQSILQADSSRQTRRRNVVPLDRALYRKIMVAIVAVRVLAGGTEGRLIDWDLVSAAFPKHDAMFIQERARAILNKSRLQIVGMQRDFQELFLAAYAKNKVPQIDYSRLEQYNWPAVVEWANFELEFTTSEQAPLLPATREEFDSIFELRPEPVSSGDELYTQTTGITVLHKRDLMARIPFAASIDSPENQGLRKADLARLEVVKTWVRSNVAAPEETYDSQRASDALRPFGDQLLESALQSLSTARVIGHANKGRVQPGRNYDITDHLLSQLNRKRGIDCSILKRATYYKSSVLDPLLQTTGSLDIQYLAEDGDILAIINLAVSGHVELRPRDAPRERFGFTDSNYLTRMVDKNCFRFPIQVRPSTSYVYGNPVQVSIENIKPPLPPPSEDLKLPPKIPLWFDIHGFLITQLWEMAIASVLGCVSIRQGLSAEGIAGMLKPALGPWEVELLLGWLAEVGVVRRQGSGENTGWMVLEKWWMVLVQKDQALGLPGATNDVDGDTVMA
ncbi:hypothetical protein N7462_004995 [Penicillium macrosclerotiorum]|uniref:uncharacterized protein n=1 Tax=Penicillium macrosclerotiorum TaxID=303699 RepID=UPI002549560A|nr:uncharacterized protein N7462_004995 [Penicillium macrosclerotiorum]KAJ5690603.1 hypothetical protein N7462_004995 [Penicillium macrosclerotiorum]